jgi:hypothetical protein
MLRDWSTGDLLKERKWQRADDDERSVVDLLTDQLEFADVRNILIVLVVSCVALASAESPSFSRRSPYINITITRSSSSTRLIS